MCLLLAAGSKAEESKDFYIFTRTLDTTIFGSHNTIARESGRPHTASARGVQYQLKSIVLASVQRFDFTDDMSARS